jgi:hypothetical protein
VYRGGWAGEGIWKQFVLTKLGIGIKADAAGIWHSGHPISQAVIEYKVYNGGWAGEGYLVKKYI